MRTNLLVVLVLILALPLFAQDGALADELSALKVARDKAVEAAVEPIDRKYALMLEQIQIRASRANDLSTAVKIRDILTAMSAAKKPEEKVPDFVGKWLVSGGKVNVPVERELKPDGTVLRSDGKFGKWTLVDRSTLRVEYADGHTVFSLPVRNNKMTGKGSGGEQVTAERKRSDL